MFTVQFKEWVMKYFSVLLVSVLVIFFATGTFASIPRDGSGTTSASVSVLLNQQIDRYIELGLNKMLGKPLSADAYRQMMSTSLMPELSKRFPDGNLPWWSDTTLPFMAVPPHLSLRNAAEAIKGPTVSDELEALSSGNSEPYLLFDLRFPPVNFRNVEAESGLVKAWTASGRRGLTATEGIILIANARDFRFMNLWFFGTKCPDSFNRINPTFYYGDVVNGPEITCARYPMGIPITKDDYAPSCLAAPNSNN